MRSPIALSTISTAPLVEPPRRWPALAGLAAILGCALSVGWLVMHRPLGSAVLLPAGTLELGARPMGSRSAQVWCKQFLGAAMRSGGLGRVQP